MLEPILVETAAIFPHRCACCGVNKAPFLDWHMEIPGFGRVYTCAYCDKTAAVIRGYLPGTKADEVEAAGELLEEKERELTGALEQLGNATSENDILTRVVAERDETIVRLEERVSQMSTTIRESAEAARQHLALVGTEPEDE